MKKFIVALVALMFLLVVACGGSGSAQVEEPEKASFDLVAWEGDLHVMRHNETGVCYLKYNGYQEGGLTLMVNPDGSPYVWEEE